MSEPEVLSTEILSISGSFRHVRRYLKGKHPTRGILHQGFTGWETIVEEFVIIPVKVYTVEEKE